MTSTDHEFDSTKAPERVVSVWFSAARTVELRQASVRLPGPGEVLIETRFSGISHGTEMLIYRGEAPTDLSLDATLPTSSGSFSFPLKYGYASVGEVLRSGDGVETL